MFNQLLQLDLVSVWVNLAVLLSLCSTVLRFNGETVSFMQSLFIHQSTVAYPLSSNETRNSYQWRVWRQQRRYDTWITCPDASIQMGVALSVVLKKKPRSAFISQQCKTDRRVFQIIVLGSKLTLTQVLNELKDSGCFQTSSKKHTVLSSS